MYQCINKMAKLQPDLDLSGLLVSQFDSKPKNLQSIVHRGSGLR